MPAINITDQVKAIQYTGSNSAEIDGLITDFTIVTETGGVLTFTSGGNTFVANTNDWVRYTQGFVLNTHPTSFLNFAFIRNAVYDDVTTINTTLTSLQTQINNMTAGGAAVVSAGILELPTLAVGPTVNAVPLTITLPSTSGRSIQAKLFASATLLGNLSITATAFASTSVVNVTVNNTALVTLTGARAFVTIT